ncbi:MAG: hypothetical protein GF308_17230 [Candidatus Heimdallarchaeota archaeon]|nr:hypothetical protein [Candidatus Heimdallarchaeota archaeon]
MVNMDQSTYNEILESINESREDMLKPENADTFGGWSRSILYHFTDTDDFLHFKVNDGKPGPVEEGEIEDPDIRIKMATDTMIKLIRGKIKGMVAFMSGKVKVKASMSDFSRLQKLFT